MGSAPSRPLFHPARAADRSPRIGRRRGASVALVTICLLATTFGTVSSATRRTADESLATIDPALAVVLAALPDDASISAIVVLRGQLDPARIRPNVGERAAAALVRSLRDHADRAQGGLRAVVRQGLARGDVLVATPLWVVNGLSVTAHPRFIEQLANRPEIASILPDNTIQAPLATAAGSGVPTEPNIDLIGAPSLWSLGFRGAGVTIASMDTGVDSTHPDLAAQWRGDAGSWFDPYGQHAGPADLNGHGTQTMGVMVGRSADGSAIGVAPDATWIAAKIFNDSGTATTTAIHLAFQWALDPDGNPATADTPSVVNNSWTFGSIGCNTDFEPDLAALMAAGITPVFAAGNFGPSGSTSASPANNPDAFAVGAVDNIDASYASSSRGPTSCGRQSPATYPALTAPGVTVRTADRGAMYTTATGTSIAAPHVTGALALLRGAVPAATPAEIRAALLATARDLGTEGADNTYGAGRLGVAVAYARLTGGSRRRRRRRRPRPRPRRRRHRPPRQRRPPRQAPTAPARSRVSLPSGPIRRPARSPSRSVPSSTTGRPVART